ncbi:DUF4183 domain-containing protein [Marinicrinis sediminis]|uniref:DUF4183 domain-containing protein n=1 Tax=Marinicrinis sediminis TaxID=1652465 RepID=A0ABW5R797_9BACL
MASLIKLNVTATASAQTLSGGTVTTEVSPSTSRYTSTVTLPMIAGSVTTIPDTAFFDDNGDPITAGNLPGLPTRGYVNVYVNGVLQQGGLLTSFTTTEVVLDTDQISVNNPVVIEVVDTTNAGNSTITEEPTVSQAAITINT